MTFCERLVGRRRSQPDDDSSEDETKRTREFPAPDLQALDKELLWLAELRGRGVLTQEELERATERLVHRAERVAVSGARSGEESPSSDVGCSEVLFELVVVALLFSAPSPYPTSRRSR